MLSLFKVSFCLPSILLVCNIVFGQGSEVDESNNFVVIGAGLNPLCIAVSEDRFACTTQASFFAKVQRFNLFTKIDESYVYLSSRKSESKDSNMKADEWGRG